MCGRYASARNRQELLEEFQVERDRVTESLAPDYNVAPTKPVYAVVARPEKPESGADGPGAAKSGADGPGAAKSGADGPGAAKSGAAKPGEAKSGEAQPGGPETSAAAPPDAGTVRELRVVRWGLVPFWAKDISIGSRLINARAETVSTKPAFRRAFARRRCLLPADGFYEWQAAGDGPAGDAPRARKQPYFIHRADGGVLAFAGIYELWRDKDAADDPDAWLWTAAIITTQAPDDLGRIHERTPMVIEPARWAEWLDPQQADEAALHALLAPAVAGALTSYPVSTEVNSVKHNGPGLIEPADPDPEPAGTPPASRRATAGKGSDAEQSTAGKLF
jgi:putative SOS response-associated peptidase YedK